MKKHLAALCIAAAALTLGSCQPHSRIDELKDFVEKIAEEAQTYSEEQWENINEEFSRLLEKVEKYDDLTPEELNEIARLQGQYAAAAFKYHGQKAKEEWEKAQSALGGFIDGLTEGTDENEETEE